MKHIFIINPASGLGFMKDKLINKITDACIELKVDFHIKFTTKKYDAPEIIEKCRQEFDGRLRFYACGGDGTLNEVVNGVARIDNAEVALVPFGSGNDFSRNFSNLENFSDIKKQIQGQPILIDSILCNDRYCFNMINIGFDCNVVDNTEFIRSHTYFKGSFAYAVGVLLTLFTRYGTKMEITIPGKEVISDTLLLSAIANGGYCGGGFHSHPLAKITDGSMDLLTIKKVSRLKFISLLSPYKKGTHLQNKRAMEVITYEKLKEFSIKFPKPTGLCYDGEIVFSDHADVKICPQSVSFSIPVGSSIIDADQ